MHDYCFKGYSLIEMNFLSHVLVNTQLPYNEHLGIFFNQIIKILSGLIEIDVHKHITQISHEILSLSFL